MLDDLLGLTKSRREKHLERLAQQGTRAEARVVEIADSGHETNDRKLGRELVRKSKLEIRSGSGAEFEWEGKVRYGRGGNYVPRPGDVLQVMYEGSNPKDVEIAPPSQADEQARIAAALEQASIGASVGGTPAATPAPGTSDQQQQAAQGQEMMQQFLSGERRPGPQREADADPDADADAKP
jgi:hypothetical protein